MEEIDLFSFRFREQWNLGYLFKNFHGKYFPRVRSGHFSHLKHLNNTNTKAITYFSCMNCHKLKTKIVPKRDRGEINHKLQGKRQRLDAEWVWDIPCCLQRVRLLRDLSAMTSTLAAGVGSRSFYPWQKGLFREMRAKQGALRVWRKDLGLTLP